MAVILLPNVAIHQHHLLAHLAMDVTVLVQQIVKEHVLLDVKVVYVWAANS
jgi:hypothetical protein